MPTGIYTRIKKRGGWKLSKKTKIKIIGVRQGEKQHEVLISKNEVPFTEKNSKKYFTIHPSFKIVRLKHPVTFSEFSSQNTEQLTEASLLTLLKKETWLFT